MYTIKNLKTLQGREGQAFTCSIYRDGKKVGLAHDDGNGGMTHVDWVDAKGAWVSREYHVAQEAAFAAWTREHAAGWITEYLNGNDGHDAELGISMLVDDYQQTADLKRHSRTKVLFRLPEDGDESYRYVAHKGRVPEATAWVRSKYPTAQVWDATTAAWTA